MDTSSKSHSNRGAHELDMLVTAGLICNFQQGSRKEVYGKAGKCFDVLLDILEDEDAARRVSGIIGSPAASVRDSAQAIIDLLLFNPENDPYVTLCLPRYARGEEIGRRRKRLISLYHPDKYPDLPEYEERAKKINEAYGKIQEMGEDLDVDDTVREIIKRNEDYVFLKEEMSRYLAKRKKSVFYRHLRVLPRVILICSFLVSVISLLLFICAD